MTTTRIGRTIFRKRRIRRALPMSEPDGWRAGWLSGRFQPRHRRWERLTTGRRAVTLAGPCVAAPSSSFRSERRPPAFAPDRPLRWAVFSCPTTLVLPKRTTHVSHKIAVIGGDGIGPEVTAEALKVVAAAGVDHEPVPYDVGGARYLRTGEVLPDEVLDELRGVD